MTRPILVPVRQCLPILLFLPAFAVILTMSWFKFPLTASEPSALLQPFAMSPLSLPEWLVGLILVAFLLTLAFRWLGSLLIALGMVQMLLSGFLLPWTNPEMIRRYLAESMARVRILDHSANLPFPNESHDPLFTPVYDIGGIIDAWGVSFHILATGWFLCLLALLCLLAGTIRMRAAQRRVLPEIALGILFTLLMLYLNSDNLGRAIRTQSLLDDLDKLESTQGHAGIISVCNQLLAKSDFLRHSTARMSQCSLGYPDGHPFRQLPAALAISFAAPPMISGLPSDLRDAKELVQQGMLAELITPLDQAIFDKSQAALYLLIERHAIRSFQARSHTLAVNIIDQIEPGKSEISLDYYLAVSLLAQSQSWRAIELLKAMERKISWNPVLADIACMKADAYIQLGDFLEGRRHYQECYDRDDVGNRRAVRALGGV